MVGFLWDYEAKFSKMAGSESWLRLWDIGLWNSGLNWTDLLKLVGVFWQKVTELNQSSTSFWDWILESAALWHNGKGRYHKGKEAGVDLLILPDE